MKKQLFYILLISLGAQFIYTDSEPKPRGSYTNTCTDITYNNGLLSATCKDVNQNPTSTGLQIDQNATNVNNCNGQLCNESCTPDWQCPAIIKAQQAAQLANLQQQLANLQQQLAATNDSQHLDKIQLNLDILLLQQQTVPNTFNTNFTETLKTIKSLIPDPVPKNLKNFSNYVENLKSISDRVSNLMLGQQQGLHQPILHNFMVNISDLLMMLSSVQQSW